MRIFSINITSKGFSHGFCTSPAAFSNVVYPSSKNTLTNFKCLHIERYLIHMVWLLRILAMGYFQFSSFLLKKYLILWNLRLKINSLIHMDLFDFYIRFLLYLGMYLLQSNPIMIVVLILPLLYPIDWDNHIV